VFFIFFLFDLFCLRNFLVFMFLYVIYFLDFVLFLGCFRVNLRSSVQFMVEPKISSQLGQVKIGSKD